MIEKLLRITSVSEITGISRSSIYAGIANGSFPKPVSIGARSVAWPSSVITAWVKSKIDGTEYRSKNASIWDMPRKSKNKSILDSFEI